MRLSDEAPKVGSKPEQRSPNRPKGAEVRKPQEDRRQQPAPINNAMAMALAKFKK